ncbi:MAG TPA: acetyltransferase [Thermoanaerobaculia bacterium]|nr:acetyltransferase [Thermoanaerobaculia bacterium]
MIRVLAIVFSMIINLAIWGTAVLVGGLFKLLTFGEARRRVILKLSSLADRWVAGNDRIFDQFLDTKWEITGLDDLDPEAHYLVIANHVSWVDIFAVLRAFHGKTAFIRFFLKHVLIWSPIVGQACWALEFPFMRRYSPEYLKEHPEKRGSDLETTRRFCQRYRRIPVAILNFVEGTRFTREKHEDQQSPYRFLLRPRVGGISFVLASLGDQLDALVDVTLVYPRRDVTMWTFVTNRVPWIRVHARKLAIPPQFGDAAVTEPGPAREELKGWVEQIWTEKDAAIATILGK